MWDKGSYTHGGLFIWIDAEGNIKEQNTEFFGSSRRVTRVLSTFFCCLPCVEFPAQHHKTSAYVTNFATALHKAGLGNIRCPMTL
jgi:hypothetical protein